MKLNDIIRTLTVMMRVIGKYEADLKNHLEESKIMYRARSEREFSWFRLGDQQSLTGSGRLSTPPQSHFLPPQEMA